MAFLIELAKQKGYTIVYSREELLALPNTTTKILGIFAAEDTYNDINEEELKKQILPTYEASAPTVAEMLDVALQRMTQKGKPFFVVLEEEGTDNGVAEWRYELPSSPALLPREKGARNLVPSPVGRGLG